MTKVKSRIIFVSILLMALTVSMAHATWEVEQIESGPDDGFITETGVKWFDTTWIELKNRAISLTSYYAFRGVNIPEDAIILNASLQFTAPHPVTFPAAESLDVTIYGLKTGDLTSWDPTPDLESEPFTTTFTNFDTTNMSNGIKINVTVTNQVKEIYDMNAWTDGNDMGFRVVSVFFPSGLATRYQESFDNSPLNSMKLYIEYTEATNTTFYYKGYKIAESEGNLTQTATVSDLTSGDRKLYQWDSKTLDADFDQTNVSLNHGANINYDTIKAVGSKAYILANPVLDLTRILWLETPDNGDTFTENITIYDSGSTQEYYSQAYHDGTFHIAYTTVGGEVYYNNVTQLLNGSWTAYYPGLGLEIASHASVSAPQVAINPVNNTIYVAYSRGTTANIIKTQLPVMFGNGFWDVATNNLVTGARSEVRVSENGTVTWIIYDNGADAIRFYQVGAGSWTDVPWILRGFDTTVETYCGSAIGLISTTEFVVVGSVDFVGGIGYPQSHTFNLGTFGVTEYQGNVSNPTQTSWCIPYARSDGQVRLIINRQTLGVYEVPANWLGSWIQIFWQAWNIKGTTHSLAMTGRDPLLGAGAGNGYIVTLNGTLIGEFDTIEEAEAAIDDIEGQTPDDPNPPGTNYPDDGFGELTRFNVRFVLFALGWFLIIAPLIIMVIKPWPLKIYLVFVVCIALGFALQWTIGSI